MILHRVIAAIVTLPLVSGCFGYGAANSSVPPSELPSPASAYCKRVGGKIEMRTDAKGVQTGWCHLRGGAVVDERALFRGEVKGYPGPRIKDGPGRSARRG